MASTSKTLLLKYGIPCVAVVVIMVQLCNVHINNLSRWKGGGYGMYTEIHYQGNQIYITGMSVDSLIANNSINESFRYLKLMPNERNLEEAARQVLNLTNEDSIHIQVWKPTINSKDGKYTRVLLEELYYKK
ncbi:hypothetical protein [Winogradskyella ouciana]|uniref:hypothetical protein n=1 Tax=Winogradskyella ouciana TaxID=2608631 RepID=UPI003D2AF83F